ncbi:lectizyme-like [Copidosoma floridanum]|uniref:lectizyme-like n=1 Tax=Copidosoma floridanum TaxID=29053 RepID=UPI0006C9611B|nr:lectizyme-like [Copidosoma floridanum]
MKRLLLLVLLLVDQTRRGEGAETSELALLAERPTRIVGGKDSEKGRHPWQVSLHWFNKKRGIRPRHVCGGTLLASGWVLTAGHCQTLSPKRPGGQYMVLAGKHELGTPEDTEQTRLVEETFVHPEYSGSVGPNDIALMKLERPFELNEYVSTVSLPYADQMHSGDAILTGWGSVSRTRKPESPRVLQVATLPLLDYEECKEVLDERLRREDENPIDPTNVCTGPLDGSQSACKGDSGGPLVVINSLDMVEIIGVVSWGIYPCAKRNSPSVYTRVSAFVPWIHQIMRDN